MLLCFGIAQLFLFSEAHHNLELRLVSFWTSSIIWYSEKHEVCKVLENGALLVLR
jgi:hypothetical protein